MVAVAIVVIITEEIRVDREVLVPKKNRDRVVKETLHREEKVVLEGVLQEEKVLANPALRDVRKGLQILEDQDAQEDSYYMLVEKSLIAVRLNEGCKVFFCMRDRNGIILSRSQKTRQNIIPMMLSI
jgi:hypothetical protein